MNHDPAHKLYYALPQVAADLVHLVSPALAPMLDFATLERLSSEQVGRRLLRRIGDMARRPYQPQAYLRLDAGARSVDDGPLDNRVMASVRLQRSATAEELGLRLLAEMGRFPGPSDEGLRQALYAWAEALLFELSAGGASLPAFEDLERPQGQGGDMATLLEANLAKWRDGLFEQGFERGRAEEREQERQRFRRQAALKFGAPTAERLSGLLGRLAGPEALLQVGDWIIECETGGELLRRVWAGT